MKKTILKIVTITLLGLSSTVNAQFIDLLTFGSSSASPSLGELDSGSNIPPFSQDSSGVNFSGSFSEGSQFYNLNSFGPLDLSSYESFWLKVGSTSSTTPAITFTIGLYDTAFNPVGTAGGSISDPNAVVDGGFKYVPLSPNGSVDLSSLGYLQFTFDGAVTASSGSILAVSTVPEPSTYALMALGGLVLFFMIRRRKAQA